MTYEKNGRCKYTASVQFYPPSLTPLPEASKNGLCFARRGRRLEGVAFEPRT